MDEVKTTLEIAAPPKAAFNEGLALHVERTPA